MKTELELINICVLNAGYARITQRWSGTGLSSPFVRLYYIKAGSAEISMPDAHLSAKPGCMYIVPSFVPHSITCEAGLEFYYLFVYERYGQQTDLFDIYSAYETIGRALEYSAGIMARFWVQASAAGDGPAVPAENTQ